MKRSKGKGRSKDGGAGGAAGNKRPPDDDDNTCPICYDADQGTRVYQYIRTTCCSCKMCTDCMKKWLETKSTCPVCHNLLKTKRSQEKLFKNTVETKEGASVTSPNVAVHRDLATPGEVGEMFRAQRERALKEKEDEQRRATIQFLVGERQGGGSGDTGHEVDPEEFAREQRRLLENVTFSGSVPLQDLERDEAAARELQAELEASDKAEDEKRREEEEKSRELALKMEEEERRKSEEQTTKRKRETEDNMQLRRRRRGDGAEGDGGESDGSCQSLDTKVVESPRGSARKATRSDRAASSATDESGAGRSVGKEARRPATPAENGGSRDRKTRRKEKRSSKVRRTIEFDGSGDADIDAKAQLTRSRGEKRQRSNGNEKSAPDSTSRATAENGASDMEAQNRVDDAAESGAVGVASPATRRRRLMVPSNTLVHDLTQDD